MQRNSVCCSSVVATYFPHAYHYCQELHRLYLPHLSYNIEPQVFQPCSAPWYLPKICSRISQACLCISASNSLRWSRNIARMSRWFALRRTSSSNGKSHSKRTIRVCTSLKTLVTLSKPIIQPMSWSSTASRNGRVLVRLSILGTDRMATLSLSLNASVPTRIQWFLKFLLSRISGSCRSPYCPNTSLVSLGPAPNFNLPILPISLCLSPGKLSESFTVQTPHLCLQDPLPTSAYRDTLDAHLQASCRSFHCPNTSLVSPGLTPNFSLSRYSKHFKNMSSPAINWQVTFNKWPHSQHAKKMKWNKTHVTWIKNTQALRCPWLYISNVPTQWSLQNLSTSSTQISRKPRSSVQTISASP